MAKPHFIVKNKFQKLSKKKGIYYKDILSKNILRDVCKRITGRTDYSVQFVDDVNDGRLATLEYKGTINYISFSESGKIEGRNYFFQSFPTALVKYLQETNRNKRIFFYFLKPDGNIKTPYFSFMYRLMKTAGTVFLNEVAYLSNAIAPFNTVDDIIAQRDLNRKKNRGNASTYITIDENNISQIFGKTYGANKYETALLCLAINRITTNPIEVYEIKEGGLIKLPKSAREIIVALGVSVFTSNLVIEQDREQFETNDSLRSPTYLYNLLEKLGDKKCSLCNCEIPQIIQGAHIYPVASIKRANNLSQDQKLDLAIDGDNGIWLCNNHHKLFDINVLYIASDGRLKQKIEIEINHEEYIKDITINRQLSTDTLTPKFINYLNKRNRNLNVSEYSFVV
jgi:hypothetical protein